VFNSNRKGSGRVFNLYWKLSSGAGADELLQELDQSKVATDWSSNGRFLLLRSNDPQTGFDLWTLQVSGDKPVRIAGGPVSAFNKQQYAVSLRYLA